MPVAMKHVPNNASKDMRISMDNMNMLQTAYLEYLPNLKINEGISIVVKCTLAAFVHWRSSLTFEALNQRQSAATGR
jgi:hypothetical protein